MNAGTERPQLEQEARERLLDAALAEAAQAPQTAPSPRATPRWFAAALVLLGAGAAVAVAVTNRKPGPAPTRQSAEELAQDPVPDPEPALPPQVQADAAALAQLDRSTQNLRLMVAGPGDLAPLAEFTALRRLALEPKDSGPHAGRGAPATGNWTLAPLAKCTQLRSLTIGYLPGFELQALDAVAALRELRELQLIGTCHVVDAAFAAVLAKMPLRSLELLAVRVHPQGFVALCELPVLERLVLDSCLHLDRCDLTQLGRLRNLERLSLLSVGARIADSLSKSNPLLGEPETPLPATAGGAGVMRTGLQMPGENKVALTPAVMRALAGLPALRELSLASSVVDRAVLEALPPQLTALDLTGTVGLRGPGLRAVVELPRLAAFSASNHPIDDPLDARLHATMGEATAERQDLLASLADRTRTLFEIVRTRPLQRFSFQGTVTPELVAALTGQPTLRELDLVLLGDADQKLDLSFAPTLPKLEHLSIVSGVLFDPAPLAQCRALRQVLLGLGDTGMIEPVQRAVGAKVEVAVKRAIDGE